MVIVGCKRRRFLVFLEDLGGGVIGGAGRLCSLLAAYVGTYNSPIDATSECRCVSTQSPRP